VIIQPCTVISLLLFATKTHLNPEGKKTKMKNTLSRCSLISVLIILVTGCTTIQVQMHDVEVKPVSQYRLFQENQGLQVSLDPYLEKDRVIKVFGTDLLSEGIFPVFVVVNNSTKDGIFLIDKRDYVAGITDGVMAGSRSVTDFTALRSFQFIPPIIGLFVTLGSDFLAYKSSQEAKIIMQNMSKKELLDKTIFPGDLHYGFLYFKLEDMGTIAKIEVIQIKAKNTKTEQEVAFIFKLNS
jgi:hypothetical protein